MKSKISNKSGDFQGGTPVMLKPLSKSRSPPFVALENHPSSSPVTLQQEDSPNKGNVRSTKKKGRGLRVDHGQEIDLKALDSKRNFDRPEAADSFSANRSNNENGRSGLKLRPKSDINDLFAGVSNNDETNIDGESYDIFR